MRILRTLSSSFVFALFLSASCSAFGQLTVDSSPTGDSLAHALTGAGVTVSDVTLTCAPGGSGTFNCVDCNVGIASGIALTSGQVSVLPGPNNSSSAGADNETPGDPDLTAIIGDVTNDACVLEFDVTVTADTLKFNYVFGSDEYLEYVGSFNDVFAFFISGPGIVGTENMALIPGTSTPVSINNVNNVTNSEYYIVNGTGSNPPYDVNPYYVQYDGITTVLQAIHTVIPCSTYHLKLAVADAIDHVLDSGVFIEAGSLSSPGVTITTSTDIPGYDNLIEGCNSATVNFHLSYPPVDTFYIVLDIGGTATNGVDYSFIPDTLTFYPGDTSLSLPITAFVDGLTEGVETVSISLSEGCLIGSSDSLYFTIYDAIPMTASNDTIICPDGTVTLTASGAETYTWSPPETIDDPTSQTTTAEPPGPITYTVTGTLGTCTNTVDVNVSMESPSANAGYDTTIYVGESAYLHATGGVAYSWSPSESLNDANIANPIATPDQTTTYIVTVTTDIGCEFTDTVTVFLSTNAVVSTPSAFSPNGDGINDVFGPVVRGQLAQYDMRIFNRWGELVFESLSDGSGWNGSYNGSDQPIGTYVFLMNYTDQNGKTFANQGNFSLVR